LDKVIKQHFAKAAKTPQEKKLLGSMLKTDKKLDAAIDRDKAKKGR
jgi:hypothetical protein